MANYLQYRTESRRLRQEQMKGRFDEVRRYLVTCLEFVDLVSIPTTLGQSMFGRDEMKEWLERMQEHLVTWKSLPVSGSGRVLFVDDKELLDGLEQIDRLRMLFYINYRSLIEKGQMTQYENKREELKSLAMKLGMRLDTLLEKV